MALPITKRLDRAIDTLQDRGAPAEGIGLTPDDVRALVKQTGRPRPEPPVPIRYRYLLVYDEAAAESHVTVTLGGIVYCAPLTRRAFAAWLKAHGLDEPPPPYAPAAAKRAA